MEKSQSIKELATALCKFQSAVETIKKTAVNPFFKSKYASLADILDVIRQPLTDNGLSFVQFPKGKYCLETMLMHVSGEWISESYEMQPTKNDPQGAGSVITYQRRYALGAILGLNIDEDDDGNKGSQPAKTLPEMHPKHKEWIKAVEYTASKGIEPILKKYYMSEDNKELMINQAMELHFESTKNERV